MPYSLHHSEQPSEQQLYGHSPFCGHCHRMTRELSDMRERCQALKAANSSLLTQLANKDAIPVQNLAPAMGAQAPQTGFIPRLIEEMGSKLRVATHALAPDSKMMIVKGILGEGHFGRVTLESCNDNRRHYAVKRPVGDQGVASLRREVHALVNIPAHRHVVGIEAAWGNGPEMALALEVADCNMRQALKGTRHSCSDLLCLMVDVCRGVSHLHVSGFVHCDLKLSNILLQQVGHLRYAAKVADFGLVHTVDEERQSNTGTFGIIPFENFGQRILAHPKQDVFSLGVMLLTIMIRENLVQQNMFCHEMLWSEEERHEFEGMTSEEMKKRFLIDLSFRKMADTGDSGFGRTMIQPANFQPLPSFHEGYACRRIQTMVHPDLGKRPDIDSIMKFANMMANSTHRVATVTSSSPPTSAGAAAGGANVTTDDDDDNGDEGDDYGDGEDEDEDEGDVCTCMMSWGIIWARVMGWFGRTNREAVLPRVV